MGARTDAGTERGRREDVPARRPHGELGDVPPQVEVAQYFAVNWVLTHAVKHGRAESVSVVLTRTGGTVRAEITDDGRGGAAVVAHRPDVSVVNVRLPPDLHRRGHQGRVARIDDFWGRAQARREHLPEARPTARGKRPPTGPRGPHLPRCSPARVLSRRSRTRP
ncbi:hypothetical protein RGQ21_34530 [Kitasatospora aureofaciens]|nr:hypothetical protein RGQ21_34530 [Kitasatospora aureofaciens]